MQRIALGLGSIVLLLGGCASKTTHFAPLPEPLTATRTTARTPAPRPAAPTRTPVEAQRPPSTAEQRDWIPSGGIAKGKWGVIVVHHSATRNDTPSSMHNYHLKTKGWANGLGYHFVIGNGVNYPDGQIYAGPRWRQQLTGAHCKSGSGRYFGAWRGGNYFNEHGIGICLIGNFEKTDPTPKQLAALERLVQFLCSRTGIDPTRVYGHGQVSSGGTLCPGRALQAKLAQVRTSVARALAGATGPPARRDRAPLDSGLDRQLAALVEP